MFGFSLIDNLLQILQAAINFFTDKMQWFFTFVTQDITTYNGGAVWNTVSLIYDTLASVGLSFAIVFMYMNVIDSSFRFIEMKKASVWIIFILSVVLLNGLFYIGKDLLVWIFDLINNISLLLVHTLGMQSIYFILPDELAYVIDMADSLDVIVFLVIVIASLFIIISTMGIMLTVYGRFFNIYMSVALAPLAMCTAFARPTRFVCANFFKNFISVCLEVIVMIAAVYIFSAFFNGFGTDLNNIYIEGVSTGSVSDYRYVVFNSYVFGFMLDTATGEAMDVTGFLVTYAAEISMMFLLLVGALKGADMLVKKIFGI